MRYAELLETTTGGFPTIAQKRVWHIGTLDASQKGDDSYEGSGVSVSLDPMAWARIARIGITPLWEATKARGCFLANRSLTEEHRAIMADWALGKGLLSQENGVSICTPAMAARMKVRNPTSVYTKGLVAAAYAEDVLDLDGVWWSMRASQTDATRGVIVPSKINTWVWTEKS